MRILPVILYGQEEIKFMRSSTISWFAELLERITPYCARVILVVEEKSSCINLHLLSARIKCKPFLSIENCIARLGNKKVFMFISCRFKRRFSHHRKDDFHQIKVHPDHKYFSLAIVATRPSIWIVSYFWILGSANRLLKTCKYSTIIYKIR
jgi:hypothetical protein